jgi:hypothetical protein
MKQQQGRLMGEAMSAARLAPMTMRARESSAHAASRLHLWVVRARRSDLYFTIFSSVS